MIFDLLELFVTFFKIGLFTIGGGYAMIPLISDEVIQRGWCTMSELTDYIAVAESTPGPFAINTATFIGMNNSGVLGVIFAVTGVVLPSLIIIIVIAKYFARFTEYKGVQNALYGMRPAVIGLMTSAVLKIAITAFNITVNITEINYIGIFIFTIVFILWKVFKLNAYKIIGISALLGIVCYSVRDILA